MSARLLRSRISTSSAILLLTSLSFLSLATTARCQDPSGTEESARASMVADRYMQVLTRRPRLGPALDSVYSFHVQNESIPATIAKLVSEVEASEGEDRGRKEMVLGLILWQGRQNTNALGHFESAQDNLPGDAIPAFYAGQLLLRMGRPTEAAKAFETALKRKPLRADFLEIGKQLGQVYQRTGRGDDAARVWRLLTDEFPKDRRVLQAIVKAQIEERDYTGALVQLEQLKEVDRDPAAQIRYGFQTAEVFAALNRRDDALNVLEGLRDRLKPGSWQFDDVRSRIEQTIADAEDQGSGVDALVAYYKARLKKDPNDVETQLRVAVLYLKSESFREAEEWFGKLESRMPNDARPLRGRLEALAARGELGQAAKVCEQLWERNKSDSDTIAQWGDLVASDTSISEAQRRSKAADIWRKMLVGRESDANAFVQFADRLRSVQLVDDAVEAYEKAIELEPNSISTREYLGEYFHQLGRREDALAMWKTIAQETRRSGENLKRLSEILVAFEYTEEALAAAEQACEVESSFDNRMGYAGLLSDAGLHDRALLEVGEAAKLADNVEQHSRVLEEEIVNLAALDRLADGADAAETHALAEPSVEAWLRLGAFRGANGQYNEAVLATGNAVAIAPKSLVALSMHAKASSESNRFADAIDAYNQLAEIDQRMRSSYVQNIANLHVRRGEFALALNAYKRLLAMGAATPANYRIYANLCFRVGKESMGLEALRQSVRRAPTDVTSLSALAAALAKRYETADAIDTYWQAYETASQLTVKEESIRELASLYERSGKFSQLVSRLEHSATSRSDRRIAQLMLAYAYRTVDDFGSSKRTLESLAELYPEDALVLRSLTKVLEEMQDYSLAIRYQRRLVALSTGGSEERELNRLLVKSGRAFGSISSIDRQFHTTPFAGQVLQVDEASAAGKLRHALNLLNSMARGRSDKWEVQYRAALLHWITGNTAEASKSAEALLALTLPSETPSVLGPIALSKVLIKTDLGTRNFSSVISTSRDVYVDDMKALFSSAEIWRAFKLPLSSYGQARAIGIAVSVAGAHIDQKLEQRIAQFQADVDSEESKGKVHALWDYALALEVASWLRTRQPWKSERLEVAKRLLNDSSTEAMSNYLRVFSYAFRDLSRGDDPMVLDEKELATIADCIDKLVADDVQRAVRESAEVCEVLTLRGHGKEALDIESQLCSVSVLKTNDDIRAGILFSALRGNLDAFGKLVERLDSIQNAGDTVSDIDQVFRDFRIVCDQLQASGRFADSAVGLTNILVKLAAIRYANLPASKRMRSSISQAVLNVQHVDSIRADAVRLQVPSQRQRYHLSNGRVVIAPSSPRQGRVSQPLLPAGPTHLKDMETTLWNKDGLEALSYLWSLSFQERVSQRVLDVVWLDWERPDKQVRAAAAGYLLHLRGRNGSAAAAFATALKAEPSDHSLRVLLCRMQYMNGDKLAALRTIEKARSDTIAMRQDRDVAICQLAAELENLELAEKALDRLVLLSLDSATQKLLKSQLEAAGVSRLAAMLEDRGRQSVVNSQSGDDLEKQLDAMVQTGNGSGAIELSTQVIQRPLSDGAGGVEKRLREKAIVILKDRNVFPRLIAQAERKVEGAPKSIPLREDLQRLYEAAEYKEDAAKTRREIGELRPKSPQLLLELAHAADQSLACDEAVDLCLQAIKADPRLLKSGLARLKNGFRFTKSCERLVGGIVDIGVVNFVSDRESMQRMLSQVWKRNRDSDVGHRLFDAMLSEDTLLAADAIEALMSYGIGRGEIESIRNLVFKVLPRQTMNRLSAGAPRIKGEWFGILNALDRLLSKHSAEAAYMAELAAVRYEDSPSQVRRVLATCLFATAGESAKATDLCEGLLLDNTLPAAMCWQIGNILQRCGDMEQESLAFYDRVAARATNYKTTALNDLDSNRVALHSQLGHRDDAKQILMNMLHRFSGSLASGEPGMVFIFQMEQVIDQFIALELKAEAIVAIDVMLGNALWSSAVAKPDSPLGSVIVERRRGLLAKERELLESLSGEQGCSLLETWAESISDGGTGENVYSAVVRSKVDGSDIIDMKLNTPIVDVFSRTPPEVLASLRDKLKLSERLSPETRIVFLSLHALIERAAGNKTAFIARFEEIVEASKTIASETLDAPDAELLCLAYFPFKYLFEEGLIQDKHEPLLGLIQRSFEILGQEEKSLAIRSELFRIAEKRGDAQQVSVRLRSLLDVMNRRKFEHRLTVRQRETMGVKIVDPLRRTMLTLDIAELAMRQNDIGLSRDAILQAMNTYHVLELPRTNLAQSKARASAGLATDENLLNAFARRVHTLCSAWLRKDTSALVLDTIEEIVLPRSANTLRLLLLADVGPEESPELLRDSVCKLLVSSSNDSRRESLLKRIEPMCRSAGATQCPALVMKVMIRCSQDNIIEAQKTLVRLEAAFKTYRYRVLPITVSHAVAPALINESLLGSALQIAALAKDRISALNDDAHKPLEKKLTSILIQNHAVSGKRLTAIDVVDAEVKAQMLGVQTPFELYAKSALSKLIGEATAARQADTVAYACRRYSEFVRRLPTRACDSPPDIQLVTKFLATLPERSQFDFGRLICMPRKGDNQVYANLCFGAERLPAPARLHCADLAGPFALLLNSANAIGQAEPLFMELQEAYEQKLPGSIEAYAIAIAHFKAMGTNIDWSRVGIDAVSPEHIEAVVKQSQNALPEGASAGACESVSLGSLAVALCLLDETSPSPELQKLLEILESHCLRVGDLETLEVVRGAYADSSR